MELYIVARNVKSGGDKICKKTTIYAAIHLLLQSQCTKLSKIVLFTYFHDALNNILLIIDTAILQLKVNVVSYHPQKLPSKYSQNSPIFRLLLKQTRIVQPDSHRFIYI